MAVTLELSPDKRLDIDVIHCNLIAQGETLAQWLEIAQRMIEMTTASQQTLDYLASVTSMQKDFKVIVDKLRQNIIEPLLKLKTIIDLLPGSKIVFEEAEHEYIKILERYCATLSPHMDRNAKAEILYDRKSEYYTVLANYYQLLYYLQEHGHLITLNKVVGWLHELWNSATTEHNLTKDCLRFLSKGAEINTVSLIDHLDDLRNGMPGHFTKEMDNELDRLYLDLGLESDDRVQGKILSQSGDSTAFQQFVFYYNPHSTELWQRVFCTADSGGKLCLRTVKQGKVTKVLVRHVNNLLVNPTTFQNRVHILEISMNNELLCYVQLPTEWCQQQLMSIMNKNQLYGSMVSMNGGTFGPPTNSSMTDTLSMTQAPKMHYKAISLASIDIDDTMPSDGSNEFTLENLKGSAIKVGKLLIRGKKGKTSKSWQIQKKTKGNGEWLAVAATVKPENGEWVLSLYDNTSCKVLDAVSLGTLTRNDVQIDDETLFDKRYCFQLRTTLQGTYYFSVDNAHERNLWLSALKTVLKPEIFGPVDYSPTESMLLFRVCRTFWIRVINTKGIPGGSHYCHIYLDDVLRAKTSTKAPKSTSQWREDFLFTDLPNFTSGVAVTVYAQNKMTKDTAHGQVLVLIPTLRRGETYDGWYPVLAHSQDPRGSTIFNSLIPGALLGDHSQTHPIRQSGNLRLKLRYDEVLVLPSVDYIRLQKLLLDHQNNLIFDLSDVAKNLEWLSETLLKVFLTKNRVVDWFEYLARKEVESTDDHNILFRGNSVFTKSLDAYMKIVGLSYVEDTIGTLIRNICQYNVACEVDPAKIPHEVDMNAQWKILLLYVRILWSSIEQSKPRCPNELKIVFAKLRSIIQEKFGNFVDTSSISPARYTCVSGFFFLRLICPAILSPKLYGLVKENPGPKVLRTLTLLAKSVQCLANLSEFGVKEPYMSPMNEFVVENSPALMEFIDFIATTDKDDDLTNDSIGSLDNKVQSLAYAQDFHSPIAPYLVDLDKECAALAFFITRHRQELLAAEQVPETLHSKPGLLTMLVEECELVDRKSRACWTSGFMNVSWPPSIRSSST
ncbi:hypothetical protein IWQ61_005565 [Dispira simplex]|nr:hypothetical protein IWQ61_005565 [Dispira simplex]